MSVADLLIEKIVLASKSKFRQKLLATCGLAVEICDSAVDEKALVGESPKGTAILRAAAKARAVAAQFPLAVVIGADQTLALGGKAFTKAASPAEAREKLSELSGRTHHLFSAVTLAYPSPCANKTLTDDFVVTIPMKMRSLTAAEIAAYVNLGEWEGCIGSYQAENVGVNLFLGIGGDMSAIIGLPMAELLSRLRALGVNPLLNPTGPWHLGLTKK